MSCVLTETTLVAGVDYEVDLVNGRILFKSTGLLGPDLETLLAGGGCGAQVDFCGTTPLHIPCPSKIAQCLPCDDDPVLNISAEDSDTNPFLFNFNTRQRPRLGFRYENFGCKRWCFSEVSQEEADLCAILQAIECINDGWRDDTTLNDGPPFQVPQPPALFFNFAQTCTTFCAGGGSFGYTLPAGQVAASNQAQANRIAFSFACRISALRRVCIRTTSLPTACLNTFYQKQLLGSGGTPFRVTFDNFEALSALCSPATSFPNSVFPYVWSATGLPNGLSLEPCSGMITGTPTQAGTFNVLLRAEDSIGSFQVKTLSLVIVEITTPAALPDATVGTPYSETLAVNPSGTYSFQFVGGSPTSWLSLNSSTGELSGTPDSVADLSFAIELESQDGTRCTKDFTLAVTVPIPDPFAYWKMEEGSGSNREDSIGALDLSPFGGGANPSVAGVIANAAELDAGGGASGLRRNNEVLFLHTGGGFTLCGWAMLPSYEGWAQLANFCELTYIISPANVFFDAFQIFAPADAFPGPGTHFKFGFYRNFGAQTIETGQDYAFNTWHFFRAWYDPADQKMHLQINNGAILDSAAFALTVGTNNASFGISSSLNIMRIDELGYWKEVLTDDVAAALYNSGNGLTWPF